MLNTVHAPVRTHSEEHHHAHPFASTPHSYQEADTTIHSSKHTLHTKYTSLNTHSSTLCPSLKKPRPAKPACWPRSSGACWVKYKSFKVKPLNIPPALPCVKPNQTSPNKPAAMTLPALLLRRRRLQRCACVPLPPHEGCAGPAAPHVPLPSIPSGSACAARQP